MLDDAHQVHDQAATEDLLGRSRLAGTLAGQLIEFHIAAERHSFAIHVDGAWGSGKSTLVNLVVEALKRSPDSAQWVTPRPNMFFDAWRESQISPAWWSLLKWLRETVHDSRAGRVSRTMFRARELGHRLRVAGLIAPTLVTAAIVGVIAAVLVLYLLRRADQGSQFGVFDTVFGLVTAVLAASTTAVGLGKVLGRWLTWRTPAGARLFERRDDNPMGDVINHARWLRKQVSGPILLVVDDIDRCSATFVVELLEAIQTLLRSDSESAQPLVIVVCADGRWLHAAFEKAYPEFVSSLEQPGRPLGHLFLDKLFQLQLRVPDLDPASATGFFRKMLGIAREADRGASTLASSGAATARIEQAVNLDQKIEVLDELVTAARGADDAKAVLDAAVVVGRTAQSAATQRDLRHELEEFIPLLESTPRAVVRFINAYAMQRISRATPGQTRPDVSHDARWTILELRWPAVALRVVDEPELLDRWHAHGPDTDDPHLNVIRSDNFRQVVVGTGIEPALTSREVRQRLGLWKPAVAASKPPGPIVHRPRPQAW